MSEKPISPLRRRMIEDMTVRNFVEKTHNDYIRHVRTFTTFLGRAGSFIEGFRTPATVQAASLPSAGIRNPQQQRKWPAFIQSPRLQARASSVGS